MFTSWACSKKTFCLSFGWKTVFVILMEQRSRFSQTGYIATWGAEDWSREGRPDVQGLPFLPHLFSDSPTTNVTDSNVTDSIHLGLLGGHILHDWNYPKLQ